MLNQVFLSTEVKRSMIISNKRSIYEELLHELPNDLRRDLRKLGNIRKISKLHRILALCVVIPKGKFSQY